MVYRFANDQYGEGAGFEAIVGKPYAHVTSLGRSLSVVASGGERLYEVYAQEHNPSIFLPER